MPKRSCVVLVPVQGSIDPRCEQSLNALEAAGYPVRRVVGYSAIDFGRSIMASSALADGFEELMWIDSDIGFDPQDVDRVRTHELPLVCGLYPKKYRPELACEFLPDSKQIVFGQQGGLHEVRYTGFGFVLTHRIVYESIRNRLNLPMCNARFGNPLTPYFLPFLVPHGEDTWYLQEDYAFCERARQCGFKITADTTVRLWHVGTYGYTWEDIGRKQERLASLTLNLLWGPSSSAASEGSTEGADMHRTGGLVQRPSESMKSAEEDPERP